MTDRETLYGIVRAVIFRNDANGYAVMKVQKDDGTDAVVVGCMPLASAGEAISATGNWSSHPVHGQQFSAVSFEREIPVDPEGIVSFLASGVIEGIGKTLAERIVDMFGEDTLNILELSPIKLTSIKGITEQKALKIGENYARQAGIRKIIDFLLQYSIPPQKALRVYKKYGELSIEIIGKNPYLLIAEEFEVDFGTADDIALDIGFESESPLRLEAAVIFELRYNLGEGHSFLPFEHLIGATMQLTPVSDMEIIVDAVDRLVQRGDVIIEESEKYRACYLRELHEAETYVAKRLSEMAEIRLPLDKQALDIVSDIQETAEVEYDDLQKEAILLAAKCKIMLLTGGPGTGKTTTLRGILSLFDRFGYSAALAAPTGRAAKRMTELCGAEATTIHRLLGIRFDPDGGGFEFMHNEDENLEFDVVILDETSMIDILLMRALVSALPEHCRLVLVGDPDQLPSVGPGNLLQDLLSCEKIATVRLTEIFRQASFSAIVVGAHSVISGIVPTFSKKDGDLFFMRRSDSTDIVSTIIELCASRLPNNMGIDLLNIQVISPMRRTDAGTIVLNRALQAALNPPHGARNECKFGEVVFREGDRVMQVRNNYNLEWQKLNGDETGLGVFNGDIGSIIGIDKQSQIVAVCYDDRVVQYSYEQLRELEHAFAITVHKSQGSEYPAVVLVLQPGSRMHINRRLLYTAITRAKKLLVIVGDRSVLNQMVTNKSAYARFSGLKQRLSGNPD